MGTEGTGTSTEWRLKESMGLLSRRLRRIAVGKRDETRRRGNSRCDFHCLGRVGSNTDATPETTRRTARRDGTTSVTTRQRSANRRRESNKPRRREDHGACSRL